MARIVVTYNSRVGGRSVISLRKSLRGSGAQVVDADYREMMWPFSKIQFKRLYATQKGRRILFAHAKAVANEILKNTDGLVLSGNNSMIDPDLFNQPRRQGFSYDHSRTIAELALVHVATQMGMPIMGICGGHQAIAVYGGGKISTLDSNDIEDNSFLDYNRIVLDNDSMLAKILGNDVANDSFYGFGAHIQVVSKLGKGMKKSGSAGTKTGNIEAAEAIHGAPVITTQFHPEVSIHGLPDEEELYIDPRKKNREATMNLVKFMSDAANTYKQKKLVIGELRKQNRARQEKSIAAANKRTPTKKENTISSKLRPLKNNSFSKIILRPFADIYDFIKTIFYSQKRKKISRTETGKKRKIIENSSIVSYPKRSSEKNHSPQKILMGVPQKKLKGEINEVRKIYHKNGKLTVTRSPARKPEKNRSYPTNPPLERQGIRRFRR